jgi:thioredoxin-like negative regulator of GroEL
LHLQDVAARLGIRGLPTFVLYKHGQRVDHFTSASIDTIEQGITDNI